MAKDDTVKLAIAPSSWQTDYFDPSVEGVEPISQAGTDVPAAKEDAVRDAAKRSGVSLKKVGE